MYILVNANTHEPVALIRSAVDYADDFVCFAIGECTIDDDNEIVAQSGPIRVTFDCEHLINDCASLFQSIVNEVRREQMIALCKTIYGFIDRDMAIEFLEKYDDDF